VTPDLQGSVNDVTFMLHLGDKLLLDRPLVDDFGRLCRVGDDAGVA
jgi:hypothetical protein